MPRTSRASGAARSSIRSASCDLMRRFAFLCLLGLSACVTDRYVGQIGHGGIYSNRGYGFAVLLTKDALETRWNIIDPRNMKNVPKAERPTLHNEPIDLDGDGRSEMGETTRFMKPALVMYSR